METVLQLAGLDQGGPLAHHDLPRLPARWGHLGEEETARWRRIIERLDAARCRCEPVADSPQGRARPHGPVLVLYEALLLAHDLFMLGHLNNPPTLRWGPIDAEAALSPWNVHVISSTPPTDTAEEGS